MVRFVLVITGLCLQFNSFSQRLEFSALASHNNFTRGGIHIGSSNIPHEQLTYTNGYGYAFGVGINEVKIGGIPFRLTLQYNHYSGGISYTYAGLGGSTNYSFTTQKDILGIGIYPVNLTFFKNLKLSLGAEVNYLIYAKQNGSESSFVMGSYQTNSTINNDTKSVNNALYVGANMSLRYEFKLCEGWKIAPQAMIYIPILSNEFKENYNSTVSYRTYLGLSLIKEL